MTKTLRLKIIRNANRCYYCDYASDDEREFDADHVIPRALGGSDDESNLVKACVSCNRSRQMKSIERKQEWVSRSRYIHSSEQERRDEAESIMRQVMSRRNKKAS